MKITVSTFPFLKGQTPPSPRGRLWTAGKKNGVIVQDKLPGIYVYYQYFRLSGEDEEYCRKGFICHIKAYNWEEKAVLRHEDTIEKAVNDRTELLNHTEFQTSPTHGLYDDRSEEHTSELQSRPQ